MPVFRLEPMRLPPLLKLLSTDWRHMAHWAAASLGKANQQAIITSNRARKRAFILLQGFEDQYFRRKALA
jgi:hypothetical protein